MSDDLRIIEELEKELGVKIGRLEGEKTESVFYRADAKGNVVQLSLKIVGLGTFPLLITQLQNLHAEESAGQDRPITESDS